MVYMNFDDSSVTNILKKLRNFFSSSGNLISAELFEIYKDIPMEIAIYDLSGNYQFVNSHYAGNSKNSEILIGKNDNFFADLNGISLESMEKRQLMFRQLLEEKKVLQYTEKLYFPGKNQTLYFKRIFQPLFSAASFGCGLNDLCRSVYSGRCGRQTAVAAARPRSGERSCDNNSSSGA